MSNSLAIAAATTGLRWILEQSLGGIEPGAVSEAAVTTLRPDKIADLLTGDDPSTGLNVFCYQIAPNHAWNLHDLPTRGADGALVRRPIAAVDLSYLITGYGNDATLDDQRLLARAVLALSVTPMLTRTVLTEAIDLYSGEDGMSYLDDADLADQPDLVKFAPTTLSLEELSKLWGIFGTQYLPSLTYRASVVLLEAQVSPRTPLPVRQPSIDLRPSGSAILLSAAPADPTQPLSSGSILRLTGSALRGPVTVLDIGGTEVVPTSVAPTEIELTLDAAVPAGLHLVRVVQRTPAPPAGGPSRIVAASNALPLLIRPTVTVAAPDAGADPPVVLQVSPSIQPGQPVTVSFSRISGGDPAWTTRSVPPEPPGTAARSSVSVPSPGVGTWLVQVNVAGADSVPTLVGDAYGAPVVTR